MEILFWRNTHDKDGRYMGPFNEVAESVWDKHGGVGHQLSHKDGMTLAQVVQAETDYIRDNPDDGVTEPVLASVTRVMEDLAALCRCGLARFTVVL